jgi:hypothetical protein
MVNGAWQMEMVPLASSSAFDHQPSTMSHQP